MHHPELPRSSEPGLRLRHANAPDLGPPTPRETGNADQRDERRSSRPTNAGQTGGELANPLHVWRSGIPSCTQHLAWRPTV
jgi:hypothetical protein